MPSNANIVYRSVDGTSNPGHGGGFTSPSPNRAIGGLLGGLTGGALGGSYISNPDKVMANLTRKDFAEYLEKYQPMLMGLTDRTLNSNELIDAANQRISTRQQQNEGRQSRILSRQTGALTPAQKMLIRQRNSLDLAKTNTSDINNARVEQSEQRLNNLSNIMGIARNTNQSAMSALGDVASNSNARDQAYKDARTQTSNMNKQMLGSALMMAAMLI